MEPKDKEKFLHILNQTAIIYEKEFNEDLIQAYWLLLKEFDLMVITEAFNQHCRQSKFFPKPAEIIGIIQGDTEDIAMVEAAKVIQAIKEYGAYHSVVFDDAWTQAVIHYGFGGWIQLCDLETHNEKWFIKDFVKIYGSYKRTNVKYFGHLIGTLEQANRMNYPEYIPTAKLIGDAEKAEMIQNAENKLLNQNVKFLVANIGDE